MNNKVEFLKSNGVDIDASLSYLGEIIKDFYDGMDGQLVELENFKNNSDMPNYAIAVHALKSNCRTLGIVPFAQIAYDHEMKSKENDVNYVNEHFSDLIQAKDKWKQIINTYLES
jgi:HPt (histidine-containing phosphotransfer) domain-containing protein